jgi:hypothetical protein
MLIPNIFLDIKNEKHDGFRLLPAVVMSLLIAIFLGAVVYILFSDL